MDLLRLVANTPIACISAVAIAVSVTSAAFAQNLVNPPPDDPGILSKSAFISVLESIADLSARTDTTHSVQFTLNDGTKIGGLLFVDSSQGLRPLVVADYGLMSSKDSGLAGDFVKQIVHAGKLNANFLVLDDVSGADFYASNKTLSLGGYDAGRLLVELAQQLKNTVSYSSLTLMGESLGGLAILEALIEDHRLKTHLFQSAITFSAVTDEDASTASVMSAFGYNLNGISGPSLPLEGMAFLTATLLAFDSDIKTMAPSLPDLNITDGGQMFYDIFAQRLQSLNVSNWNSSVSRTSVEDYVTSSSTLLQQISEVSAPVIVVHAQNDPIVPYSQFQAFADEQLRNSNISTLGTDDGSHCGFLGAYGADWVASLVNRAIGL